MLYLDVEATWLRLGSQRGSGLGFAFSSVSWSMLSITNILCLTSPGHFHAFHASTNTQPGLSYQRYIRGTVISALY